MQVPAINPRTGSPSVTPAGCFGLTISNGKVINKEETPGSPGLSGMGDDLSPSKPVSWLSKGLPPSL